MSHRSITRTCLRAATIGLAVFSGGLDPPVVAGQAPAAGTPKPARKAAIKWTAPRTSDGQPDLEGIWNFATLTPLERPGDLAGKQALTDEEAAEFEKQVVQRTNADRRDGSPATDLGRAYNDFWYDRGSSVATVNGVNRTSLIVDPADGRIPALTAEGQTRAAARAAARKERPADGPEDRPLTERCLAFNAGPPMISGAYNNYVQILQTRDHVVIVNEMIHDARIVPLDGRPHIPPGLREWLGDSRGRWDGDTLIVDTTNFTNKTNFRGSSDKLHLVERFTRVAADTVIYEFTVDDPTSFTRPWTAVMPMRKSADRMFEYACHEANYSMSSVLRGARAEEKAEESKKRPK